MTEGIVGDSANRARDCGYPPCGRPLPAYSGRGRPQEFCKNRHDWPGGRSCQQMDADRRAAELAAGLDVPLDAFRAASGPLVDTAEALADRLLEVLTAVRAVDGGALTRIADAEQAMREAVGRAQTAETERDQAVRDRHTADTARARAQEAAGAADRRATTARRDADQQVRAALDRVADAERDRGQAQATAAAAQASAAEETRRREHADQRAAEAQAETRATREHLDTAVQQLAGVRAAEADLRTQLADATARAELAQAERTRLHEQVATLTAQADTAERDREELRQRVTDGLDAAQQLRDIHRAEIGAVADEATRLRQELAAAQHVEATATAAAQTATDRLTVAETRIDQLLAALPPTAQPDPDPDSGGR